MPKPECPTGQCAGYGPSRGCGPATLSASMKPSKQQYLEAICRNLAPAIDAQLDEREGFALLLFDFGEKGSLAYISNAQRRDMIRALRECADELEKDI